MLLFFISHKLQRMLLYATSSLLKQSNYRYSVLSGPNSEFFEFENELEGTLVLKKPLDYETLRQFEVNIRAQDHGDPPRSADTVLTVYVIDADDQNPR